MDTKDLAVIRQHVDEATADIDVWADRQEPDARARRYASAAVDAIDAAIAELYSIRAKLTNEIRASDDAAATRADTLLADTDALLAADLASCGHPRDEDGECSCSSWPERARTEMEREQEAVAVIEGTTPAQQAVREALTPPRKVMDAFREATSTPAQCRDHHPSGKTNCTREGGHQGAHHNGSGLIWSAEPALDGYGYQLPEDYLSGGAQ
jgi:hypothetical protein